MYCLVRRRFQLVGVVAGLAATPLVRANDASGGLIYKGVYYIQTSTAAPTLAVNPYDANAQVIEGAAGSIVPSPTVTPSMVAGGSTSLSHYNGVTYSLGADSDANAPVRYATLAAMNAAAPARNYTLSYTGTTQSGSWTMAVTSPSSLSSFPVAPHISNYAAISSFNAANGVTINWDALGGSSLSSLVVVSLVDETTGKTYSSPLALSGGLNGTSTTYSFPAADFTPLHQYAGAITYAKVPTQFGIIPITYTDANGVIGAFATVSVTGFTLNATPAPGDANGDGKINADDYLALDDSYARRITPGAFPLSWEEGDFNGDGMINAADYAILDSAFKAQNAGASVVAEAPEPASLVYLLPLVFLARGRRRITKG